MSRMRLDLQSVKGPKLMQHLIIYRDHSHPVVKWTEADLKGMMTEVTLRVRTSSSSRGNKQPEDE